MEYKLFSTRLLFFLLQFHRPQLNAVWNEGIITYASAVLLSIDHLLKNRDSLNTDDIVNRISILIVILASSLLNY